MGNKENFWLGKLTSDGLHLFNPVTNLNILDSRFCLPACINIPLHIAIELTKKCSKRCNFCYASSTETGTSSWTKEEVIRFCKNLVGNVFTINFGGGEPFEFAGIAEILNSLKDEPVALSVTTNGLLLEKYLPYIEANDKLTTTVSLHEPEEIDFVIKRIELIKSHGFKTSVNVLLRNSRLHGLKEVIPQLANLMRINFLNFKPYGLAMEQSEEMLSSETLLSFLKELDFKSAYVSSCERIPEGVKSVYGTCGALRRWVTVTSEKTVKPCSFTDIEVPLKDYSYESLIDSLGSCPLPCRIRGKEIRENNGMKIWFNSNSSHSMDSTFWAITDDSMVKFFTGEEGVLPDWPELYEEEFLQELLAETLVTKKGTKMLKKALALCKIEDLQYGCDRTIYVSSKPIKENPKIITPIMHFPEIRSYRYGFCVDSRGKNKKIPQFSGFEVFSVWLYELVEVLAYCYSSAGSGNNVEDYRNGYIDVCGNELIYTLDEKPEILLKDLAPKLFSKLHNKLVLIEQEQAISMANEEHSAYYDEPIAELMEEEEIARGTKRKK